MTFPRVVSVVDVTKRWELIVRDEGRDHLIVEAKFATQPVSSVQFAIARTAWRDFVRNAHAVIMSAAIELNVAALRRKEP